MDGQQRTGHGLGQSAPRVPSVVPRVGPSSGVSTLDSFRRSVGEGRQTIPPQAQLRRPQNAPATYLSQVRASLGGRAGQIPNADEFTAALLQSRGAVQNSAGLASLAKEQVKPIQGPNSQGIVFSATAPHGLGQGRAGSHMVLPTRQGGSVASRPGVSRPGGGHPQVQKSTGFPFGRGVGRMDRIQNNVQVKPPTGFLIGQPHQSFAEKDKQQQQHQQQQQQQQKALQGQSAARHLQGQRFPALQRGVGLPVVHKTGAGGGGGGGGGELNGKQGDSTRVVVSGAQRQAAVVQATQHMLQLVNPKALTQRYVYFLRDDSVGLDGDGNAVAQLTNNQGVCRPNVSKMPNRGNGAREQIHVDGNGRVSPGGTKPMGARGLSGMNMALVRGTQDQLQQQAQPGPRDSFPKYAATRIMEHPPEIEQMNLCDPPGQDIVDPHISDVPRFRATVHSMEMGAKAISRPPSVARSVCSSGMDNDVMTAAESLQGLATGGSAAKKIRLSGEGESCSRRVPASSSSLLEEEANRGGVREFSGLDLLWDAATRAGDEVGRHTRIKRPSRLRVEAEETEYLLNEKHSRIVANRKVRHFTRQSQQSDLSRQQEYTHPPAAFKTHERYRGVTPTNSGKFIARCRFRGGAVQIGVFDCAHDASKAYDRVILGLRGPQASTNHSRQEYLGFEISNAKRAFFDDKVQECVQIRKGSPRHWVAAAKHMLASREILETPRIFPALGGDVDKIVEILEAIRRQDPGAFDEAVGRMQTESGEPVIKPSRRGILWSKVPPEPFSVLKELGDQGKTIEEALEFVEHGSQKSPAGKELLQREDHPNTYPYVAEMLRAMVLISQKWEGEQKPQLAGPQNKSTGSVEDTDALENPSENGGSLSEAGTPGRNPSDGQMCDADVSKGEGGAVWKNRTLRGGTKEGSEPPPTCVSDLVPVLANGSRAAPSLNGAFHMGRSVSVRVLPGQMEMDAIDASLQAVTPMSPIPHQRASESPVVINGNRVRGRRPAPRRGAGRVIVPAARTPPMLESDEENSSMPENSNEADVTTSPGKKRGGEAESPDSNRRKMRRVTRVYYRGQKPSRGLKTGRVRRRSLGGLTRDRASEYTTSSSNNSMNGEEDDEKGVETRGVTGGGRTKSANIDRRASREEGSPQAVQNAATSASGGDAPKCSGDSENGGGLEVSKEHQSDVGVGMEQCEESESQEEDKLSYGAEKPGVAVDGDGISEPKPESVAAESDKECDQLKSESAEFDEKEPDQLKSETVEYDAEDVAQRQGGVIQEPDPPESEPPPIQSCSVADNEEVTLVGEGSGTGACVVQQGHLVATNDNPISISSLEETEEGMITVNGSQLVVELAEEGEGEVHWERGSKTATSMEVSETVDIPWQGENESVVDSVRWLRLLASSLWPKKRGGGMICRAFDRNFSGGRHRERMLDVRKCLFKDIDGEEDM